MTCVMYQSISGFTKRYAEIIASALACDCLKFNEDNLEKLSKYDTVIFGGSLHAVGITGLKRFNSVLSGMEKRPRNLVVFAVGASPGRQEIVDEVRKTNLQDLGNARFFYLRGGFDFNKLDVKNKVLMRLFQLKLMMTKEKTNDEIGMLNAYKTPIDFVDEKYVSAIIEHVKQIEANDSEV